MGYALFGKDSHTGEVSNYGTFRTEETGREAMRDRYIWDWLLSETFEGSFGDYLLEPDVRYELLKEEI